MRAFTDNLLDISLSKRQSNTHHYRTCKKVELKYKADYDSQDQLSTSINNEYNEIEKGNIVTELY